MRLLVSVPRLHSVSVVSKPASTGSRETVGAEHKRDILHGYLFFVIGRNICHISASPHILYIKQPQEAHMSAKTKIVVVKMKHVILTGVLLGILLLLIIFAATYFFSGDEPKPAVEETGSWY